MKPRHIDYRSMIPLTGLGVALLITFIMWLAMPSEAHASSDKATSPDTVIASWPVTSSTISSASEAMDILMTSRLFNRSAMGTGQVQHYLNEQEARGSLDADHTLLKARLLQLNHEFEAASTLLKGLVTSPMHSANAQLLFANIQIQMGNFEAARATCSNLFGQVALIVTLTCSLDADFQSSPSRATYTRLASLLATRATAPVDQIMWVNETLASMALQLDEPELAREHLADIELSSAPVSLVALWMDTHIHSQSPAVVLEQIVPLIDNAQGIDDAILLRLAIVEAQLGKEAHWQQKMRQRVTLREWRQDDEHAAQLSRYYLDVAPDPQKALYFASQHYQHSKTAIDAALLARATAVVNAE